MTASQSAAGHHAYAATHHGHAAQFHRDASRHYQIGKDYAHAAHQALSAHGHALRALEHGQAASALYAAHDGSPLPNYLGRTSEHSRSTAVAAPADLTGWALHLVAADHHEAAARHHEKAAQHSEAEHYVRAAHETHNALDHGKHALFHDDRAAMHHMEHYGCHPWAELV